MDGNLFQQAIASLIAAPGEEDAPVLAVTLSHEPNGEESEAEMDGAAARFRCEATLLSGATLTCSLADANHTDLWGQTRPGPTVNDLAIKLVKLLPWQAKVRNVKRIFMNFIMGDGAEHVAATPWDWDRPLTDFLPSPAPTPAEGEKS